MNCSFCGNSVESMKVLIVGPEVNICDECVDVCVELIAAALSHPGQKVEARI